MLIVGLIGAMFIIAAWLYETLEEMKKHKSLIDLKFSLISAIGTGFLILYSYLIGNFVFFWLNICIGAIIIFEAAYTIHITKFKK